MGYKYVEAIGRNPGEQYGKSHLYLEVRIPEGGLDYEPMCGYAWNRSDGEGFSIFRGHRGSQGLCKICEKRSLQGLRGVPPMIHRTKWL